MSITSLLPPPGREALLGLGRGVRRIGGAVCRFEQRTVSIVVLWLNWMWRVVCGFCRNTTSLLLGAALAALFGVGVVAGFGGAMVGSANDPVVTRLFSNSHLVAEAIAAYSRGQAVALGAAQPDNNPSLSEEDSGNGLRAVRLAAFAMSALGFYLVCRSAHALDGWWNNKGKFGLRPKGKTALEFTGWSLVAFFVGLAGLGLIYSSAGTLTSDDATVLRVAGAVRQDWITNLPPTVEDGRLRALVSFCLGLVFSVGVLVFVGWAFCKIVTGLRSFFVSKPATP